VHWGEDRFDADRGEDFVEAGGELRVAVAYEEPHPSSCIFELGTEVAGNLGDPGSVWVGGDAGEMDDASFELDLKQHVVVPEEDGVDGEEVGGHDALGLGAEELGPAGSGSTRGWRKPMASKDVGDAALGACDAGLLQFADDANVAPARKMLNSTFPPLRRRKACR
jgi:hypothetical protein